MFGVHLHLGQVRGEQEQRRRLHAGRDRLPTSTLREITMPSIGA